VGCVLWLAITSTVQKHVQWKRHATSSSLSFWQFLLVYSQLKRFRFLHWFNVLYELFVSTYLCSTFVKYLIKLQEFFTFTHIINHIISFEAPTMKTSNWIDTWLFTSVKSIFFTFIYIWKIYMYICISNKLILFVLK
jgi:hypothetical protein